ncbi:MAG: alpha/beta fold hydrolase [Gammaproteobacteria bacterium]|nr:alpha/beta fold hydrolase [Gammaproteobacteria bacterium]
MPYAMSQSLRIYYESHGAGPVIAFLHGAGGNHAAWWQQTAHFRSRYRVINVDLRGFGRSDSQDEGPDALDFPDDLLAVLDHAGIERATLLGQSIGAVAALRFATAHPTRVEALILAHSLGGMGHPQLTPLVAADRAAAEKVPVLDRLLTREFQQAEPARTFLFQQLGSFNSATMRDLRNVSAPGPALTEVVRLGLRIFLLTGEKDAVLSPATIRVAQKLLPGSVLTVVPGAPHSMYWEAPEPFNRSVHAFLQQIYGAT